MAKIAPGAVTSETKVGPPPAKKARNKTTSSSSTINLASDQSETDSGPPKKSFLDIPAELRIKIYGLVFRDITPLNSWRGGGNTNIQIVHHDRGGKKWSELYQEKPDQNFNKKRKRRVYNPRPHGYDPKLDFPTAILATCREIYEEAAEVLYGSRVFQFHSLKEIKSIIPYLGNAAKYLKYFVLEYTGYTKKHAAAAFAELAKCTNLRAIMLDHNIFCKSEGKPLNIGQLCKDTLPVFKALQKSYEDAKLKYDVLGLVELECQASRYRTCSCSDAEVAQKNANLEEELNELVANNLGIERPEKEDQDTGEDT